MASGAATMTKVMSEKLAMPVSTGTNTAGVRIMALSGRPCSDTGRLASPFGKRVKLRSSMDTSDRPASAMNEPA